MRAVVVCLLAALAIACRGGPPRRPSADLPTLVAPEIVVSLQGRTVHLFDRETGFSVVYPAMVGYLDRDGRSVTPTGRFTTGPDVDDRWWYMERRTRPALFGGYPFLRITAKNRRGKEVYGLHGPIHHHNPGRGFMTRGCVRLAEQHILDLYEMVRRHPSTPVTIQEEVERDARGRVVDVGMTPALEPRAARR
jgi:lipoprotein-anchoring transpeptidase ErfK/SrfK